METELPVHRCSYMDEVDDEIIAIHFCGDKVWRIVIDTHEGVETDFVLYYCPMCGKKLE